MKVENIIVLALLCVLIVAGVFAAMQANVNSDCTDAANKLTIESMKKDGAQKLADACRPAGEHGKIIDRTMTVK